jgi:hypothetical protein
MGPVASLDDSLDRTANPRKAEPVRGTFLLPIRVITALY